MFLNTGNVIFLSTPVISGGSTSNPSGVKYFDVYHLEINENNIDITTPVAMYAESIGRNVHDGDLLSNELDITLCVDLSGENAHDQ